MCWQSIDYYLFSKKRGATNVDMVDAVQEPDHMYEYVTGLNVRSIDKMRHTINSKAYRKIQQTENSINVRWVRISLKNNTFENQ